jgi:ribosomal protein S18 acetylase RimI-like enzyme
MIEIKTISSPGLEFQAVVEMFQEYRNELNENINFQDFGKELSNPLAKYGPPDGILLIALNNGTPAGCIALHALDSNETCEMKRLFVRPAFRSCHLGKTLCDALIHEAKKLNYKTMVLDTLERLKPAISLYKSLGFSETEPYYNNPLAGVIYIKKDLR